MAGSLHTSNYNLAKYAADDITSWLIDFNGNMDLIDAAIKARQDAITSAEAEIALLQTLENANEVNIEGLQDSRDTMQKSIAANSASIETLKSEVGVDIIPSSSINTYNSYITFNDNNYFNGIFSIGSHFFSSFIMRVSVDIGTIPCVQYASGNYISPFLNISGNVFDISGGGIKHIGSRYSLAVTDTIPGMGNIFAYYQSSTNTTYIGTVGTSSTHTWTSNEYSKIDIIC